MISKPFVIAMVSTLVILAVSTVLCYWFMFYGYSSHTPELFLFIRQFLSALWVILFIPIFAFYYKVEKTMDKIESRGKLGHRFN